MAEWTAATKVAKRGEQKAGSSVEKLAEMMASKMADHWAVRRAARMV